MTEPVAPLVVILLACVLGLLVLVVVMLVRLSGRLARAERRLVDGLAHEEATRQMPVEASVGGAFETFLQEDPARGTLPKAEQFAAYRRWRQDHGLNWSNS